MLLTLILAWEMVSRKLSPHPCLSAGRKIGCAFFVTFFAQAKKVKSEISLLSNSFQPWNSSTLYPLTKTTH